MSKFVQIFKMFNTLLFPQMRYLIILRIELVSVRTTILIQHLVEFS